MVARAAHAEESSEISLHNEEGLRELLVVRNWTLICEDLCRLVFEDKLC